jgi:hypothetical protein
MIDNVIVVGALMLAFALALPTAVDYDTLTAADDLCTVPTSTLAQYNSREGAIIRLCPPSRFFLTSVVKSELTTCTLAIFAFMISMVLTLNDRMEEATARRIVGPWLGAMVLALFYGIFQLGLAFYYLLFILVPDSANPLAQRYNLEFSQFPIFIAALALVPIGQVMWAARKASRQGASEPGPAKPVGSARADLQT